MLPVQFDEFYLSSQSMGRLFPQGCLDQEVLEAGLRWARRTLCQNNDFARAHNSCLWLNTFFFTKLMDSLDSDPQLSRLSRWTARTTWSQINSVMIPIHLPSAAPGGHWVAAVIRIGATFKIQILDNWKHTHPDELTRVGVALSRWTEVVLKQQLGRSGPINVLHDKPLVWQQQGSNNCGLFCITNLLHHAQ